MILALRRVELQVDRTILLLQLDAIRTDRLHLPAGERFPFADPAAVRIALAVDVRLAHARPDDDARDGEAGIDNDGSRRFGDRDGGGRRRPPPSRSDRKSTS